MVFGEDSLTALSVGNYRPVEDAEEESALTIAERANTENRSPRGSRRGQTALLVHGRRRNDTIGVLGPR